MNYEYYYYGMPYNTAAGYVNVGLILAICAGTAALLGAVLFFTFLRKKNEGRFHGIKGKMYNFLNFNRFYTESIIKFIYVLLACALTVTGIALIVLGLFFRGLFIIVLGNAALRIVFELLMMFIILCRKTVSADRRLAAIEKFYSDSYEEEYGPMEEPEAYDEDEDWDGVVPISPCNYCGDQGACSSFGDFESCHADVVQEIKEKREKPVIILPHDDDFQELDEIPED